VVVGFQLGSCFCAVGAEEEEEEETTEAEGTRMGHEGGGEADKEGGRGGGVGVFVSSWLK